MKFTVTVPPALEPISLAEAKDHCRITHTDEDALLAGYIVAARHHVEHICGIALITQTLEAYYDYFPAHFLPRWPVQSVSSVTYLDQDAAVQTLATNTYYSNIRARPSYVSILQSYCWPDTYQREDVVTVTFVAGYGSSPASIPEPIRQAMLLLIGHWYENRETVSVGVIAAKLPYSAESLLASFRVFY